MDAVLGQAIDAWQAVRPEQPPLMDAKTSEVVDFLFCYRAKRLRTQYLNLRLIPLLCQKKEPMERSVEEISKDPVVTARFVLWSDSTGSRQPLVQSTHSSNCSASAMFLLE